MFSTHKQENWYLLSTNTSGAWHGKRTTVLARWLAFIANCYKQTADYSGVVLRTMWRILYGLSMALVTAASVREKFGAHLPSLRIPSFWNAEKTWLVNTCTLRKSIWDCSWRREMWTEVTYMWTEVTHVNWSNTYVNWSNTWSEVTHMWTEVTRVNWSNTCGLK